MQNSLINDNEIEILNSMIGKNFSVFKCDPFIYSPMVYGIVGIYINDVVYKLTVSLSVEKRFLVEDEVAVFRISKSEDKEIKTLMDGGEMIDNPVNAKIAKIDLVNDYQTITNNGVVYEFNSTVGIIFHLVDGKEISFEIGTWFSEMITIKKGYNLIEKFTPITSFFEEWDNCDGYIPKCTRKLITLQ